MYQLHYYPGNASLAPHLLLQELGVPFALELVDRRVNLHKSPAYLKLNPNGLIPTLIDGDLVLWETSAILMHIADRAGFAPGLGTAERAHYTKWLVHLTNTIQAEYIVYYYPERYADDEAGARVVKAHAETHLIERFERVAAQLGGGPYVLGDRLSAADFMLLMLIRWGRGMRTPPRSLPALGAHAARMLARPSVRLVFETEGLAEPFV